ncbi:MAG: F0F1 ATP synthase subunit A [Verrucomicrobiales bacterium]|nr:F0F1 ATP synthase subunit A [Verrucomicrobiales bacterium]
MELHLPMFAFDNINPLIAAGGINAPEIPALGWISNSIVVAVIVTVGVLLFTRMATQRRELIPGSPQNLVEYLVEFLYGQVEGIVGKHVAPKAFPLLATVFIFILASNWFGLLPGVGTIGFGVTKAPLVLEVMETPLLRPATADLNMTLALAVVFMAVWAWLSISELGFWGTIVHIFGPKGGLQGALKYLLTPIFIFVGIIEVVSIVFRPMSLSLRLLGNIFAGETLLHTMGELGEKIGLPSWMAVITSVVFPLPFYFMEILVGALQATVFSLLCAVYIKLATTHDEAAH